MSDFAAAVACEEGDDDAPDDETCAVDDDEQDELPGHHDRRRTVRAKTVSVKQMRPQEVRFEGALWPSMGVPRPRRRADCRSVERPCPFVGCRHHLFLDVTGNGSIKYNFPDLQPEELPETCSLDIADAGGKPLWRVGELMNMTRERIRQVEEEAVGRLRAVGGLKALRGTHGPIERESFLPDPGMFAEKPSEGIAEVAPSAPQEVEKMGAPKTSDEQIITAIGAGPTSTQAAAIALGVCPEGLTPRLEKLRDEGRVSGGERGTGTGRPRLWSAGTGKAGKAKASPTPTKKAKRAAAPSGTIASLLEREIDRQAHLRAAAILRAHADAIEAEAGSAA
jgi:hypothetical protein